MTDRAAEVEKLARGWYELWNAEDKEAWLAHWKSCAPGEPHMEDPVGTPVKRGWALASELWDRSGPGHPHVRIDGLIVGGNECAVICHNEGYYKGRHLIIPSVDLWRINDDGSSTVRAFWEIPENIPYGKWTSETGTAE